MAASAAVRSYRTASGDRDFGARSSTGCSASASRARSTRRYAALDRSGQRQSAHRSSRSTCRAGSTPTPASRRRRRSAPRATATFIALKPGLLTGDGPDHCGAISVHRARRRRRRRHAGDGRQRLDWAALRAALPDVLVAARAQRAQGNVRHAGDRRRRRRHGRRAAPRRRAPRCTLGAGKVLGRLRRDRPPGGRLAAARADAARRGDVLDAGADALVIGPGLGTGEAARASARARARG